MYSRTQDNTFFLSKIVKILMVFLFFIKNNKKCGVGTHKNDLCEEIMMSKYNVFSWENKKNTLTPY